MPTDIHERIKAQMDEAVASMRRELDVAMFRDTGPHPPIRPLTRRERLHRRWLRVKGYGTTLWRALKGEDLVPPYDASDW